MRIQQLSAFVANQISAGEVIERPASVVKELLENALDAGASAINIEIGYGGLNQIKISDNGAGILADDLPLAIAAHATSKITQLDDLYALNSMGFRGEALASIAAVSRLSLSSKPSTQEHAMMLRLERGEFSIRSCARSNGTTVEVLDLFYNAPVRKTFLKTARSEYQAIEMVVKRFALSAPTVALTLKHDAKDILSLPAAHCEKTRLLRIKKLLGKPFIESALYLDVEQGSVRLVGWVSGETYQRSQNDKIWVYINQRMVKDKLINHAIKQAYERILHAGRSPACVLYLTLPPQDIDVNVHPTKHEVRFQQPRLIHDFFSSTLLRALTEKGPPNSVVTPVPQNVHVPLLDHGLRQVKHTIQVDTPVQHDLTKGWHVLNAKFVLLFLGNGPYLIDILEVQHQWRLSVINQQILPLASRPLLVPVCFAIDEADCSLVETCLPMLKQFGVELDWVGALKVALRTIPQILPQLDIQTLLKGLVPLQSELLTHLVECHTQDAYHIDHEDKQCLIYYLQQQLPTNSSFLSGCLRLDIEKCRELMSGVTT